MGAQSTSSLGESAWLPIEQCFHVLSWSPRSNLSHVRSFVSRASRAGGFLQSAIFGTSGMRLVSDGLTFNPPPPRATGSVATMMGVRSFHFRGHRLTQVRSFASAAAAACQTVVAQTFCLCAAQLTSCLCPAACDGRYNDVQHTIVRCIRECPDLDCGGRWIVPSAQSWLACVSGSWKGEDNPGMSVDGQTTFAWSQLLAQSTVCFHTLLLGRRLRFGRSISIRRRLRRRLRFGRGLRVRLRFWFSLGRSVRCRRICGLRRCLQCL